jgi:tetratricopeptide (TPR) repeat protein
LLERTKRWDELVVLLEHSVAAQPETALKIAVLRRLTEIHRRERKDPQAATATLALLLDLDPEDRTARTALTDDLLALGRWNEAAELIDRRVRDSTSKAEQVPLLRQLGELFEQRLGDNEAAFHNYERLLELVPNDAVALDRMEAIDEAAGAHERLLSTLERRLDTATPAQAANLLVRMATIAEADLLDQDRACGYLQVALQRQPNNAQISTALANLYERSERFPELLALLREKAGTERSGKARAEIYRRIARILAQRLNDPRGAGEAYAKVNEAGDDHEAWTYLADRAREAGDDNTLAHALARVAPLETTAPARRAALFERAILLPKLGRPADAVDPLVAILTELDPGDVQARQTLNALCESLGDQRGVSRVLEAHLSRAEEPDEQAALARELAELYATKLPDEARGVRALTIWAKATPTDPEPLRRLAVQHDKKRKYKELLDVVDALARVEKTPEARGNALERAALLAYTRLKDETGAFTRLMEFTRTTRLPLSAALLDLIRRLGRVAELCDSCEQEQRYDEFFLLLRERISASLEPLEKVELYRRLAAGLIEHRQDDDGALAAYEGLLAVGDDIEALRFVQSWAMRHDDPERLVAALLRLAHAEKNPEEQRDLLYERGRLLLTRLARPQEAISAFEEAASVDPSFAPALDELAAACESAGDHARLAQTLERQLAHEANPHDPLGLVRRLAELYEGAAADDKRAAAALARWAELDLVSPEPLRRLRRRQERSDKSPELLKTLDALAEREPDANARNEAQVAAAVLAFERFGDAAGAFARLSPLVAAAEPNADAALIKVARASGREPELYDLLERAQRYAELVEQLEISARTESEPTAAAALLRRAARILHDELDDDDRAEAVFTRLLAIQEDAEALRFMQARAIERKQPKLLADTLQRLARLESDPRELRDLLFDQAHLLRTQLEQPKAAITLLQRILSELDPDFEPALDALVAAAEAAGDPLVLAGALERQLKRETEPHARADLAARLAELYADQARDPAALALVLDVWAHDDPDNVVPHRRKRELPPAQRTAPRLLHALDEIARLSERRDERLDAERAAAELCATELQDPDQAFERSLRLARVGVAWGEDLLRKFAVQAGKLSELTDYYSETGRYEEVVELLRQRAQREVDDERRAELTLVAARTLADRVGDETAASEAYREVLEIREDGEALSYLRTVAERAGDTPELEKLLGRMVQRTDDVNLRRELQLRRAELLANGLERPHAAVAILKGILEELDPTATQAASALIEVAGRIRDFAALSLGLSAKLSLAHGPSERHSLAMRLADLYGGPLADADRAALALKLACESDPDDLEAQRRLRVHLERQRAFPELVQTLDVLSRIEDTQAGRDAARLAAARVLFEQLDDAQSALVRLSPLIFAADPEAERVAEAVCRAKLGRELASVYITRAKQSTDPELVRLSWHRIADIHEHWLDEPAEAFEASLRLLATDATDRKLLDEVDRLSKKTQSFRRLQAVYGKLVREARDDSERIQLLLRLAALLENDARDASGALAQLMAASKLNPEDGTLLMHVERLASELGSNTELAWAKEQKVENASSPAAAIHALLDLARTVDLRLRDREAASAALRRALTLLPGAPELHASIMQLAAELDQARPELGKEDAQRSLVRVHLALAEQAEEPRRTELVLAAFRWVSETLGDAPGGFDVLRAGSNEPPVSEAVLEALETAASKLHRLDALNAHLARIAERAQPDQKRELLARRARILEERLRRYDQAAQAYERLLEMDPHDLAAEARHFACLKQAGRHRELLQALERRLQRSTELERRTALMREIARVWEVDLKNRASAAMVWTEVQALLPHDAEAQAAIARLAGAAQ